MFNKFIAVSNNTNVALCLSVIFDWEIARDVAFRGEVGLSACFGMP